MNARRLAPVSDWARPHVPLEGEYEAPVDGEFVEVWPENLASWNRPVRRRYHIIGGILIASLAAFTHGIFAVLIFVYGLAQIGYGIFKD